MKNNSRIILMALLIISTFYSCNKCKNYDCFTPPPSYAFEFVDSLTGKNLYSNHTFDMENFTAKSEFGQVFESKFDTLKDGSGRIVVILPYIWWQTGSLYDYDLQLDTSTIVTLSLEMTEKYEKCCTFFDIKSLNIKPYAYELQRDSGIVKVFIRR